LQHIVFHAHSDVTEAVRQRAEQSVRKLASRIRGTTDASIRFDADGAVRRAEIVLRAARRAPLVAEGSGSRYEFALAAALDKLEAHVAHVRAERERKRRRGEVLRLEPPGLDDGVEFDADFADMVLDEPVRGRAAEA